MLTVGDEMATIAEWARRAEFGPSVIRDRLRAGWTPAAAVGERTRPSALAERVSLPRLAPLQARHLTIELFSAADPSAMVRGHTRTIPPSRDRPRGRESIPADSCVRAGRVV